MTWHLFLLGTRMASCWPTQAAWTSLRDSQRRRRTTAWGTSSRPCAQPWPRSGPRGSALSGSVPPCCRSSSAWSSVSWELRAASCGFRSWRLSSRRCSSSGSPGCVWLGTWKTAWRRCLPTARRRTPRRTTRGWKREVKERARGSREARWGRAAATRLWMPSRPATPQAGAKAATPSMPTACANVACPSCGKWTSSTTPCWRSTRSCWGSAGVTRRACATPGCRPRGPSPGTPPWRSTAWSRRGPRHRGPSPHLPRPLKLPPHRRHWRGSAGRWSRWTSGWARTRRSTRPCSRRSSPACRRPRVTWTPPRAGRGTNELLLPLLQALKTVTSSYFTSLFWRHPVLHWTTHDLMGGCL